jgi:putative flippase GtrA
VLQLANVGSIALGTVVRFLSYRRWVFVAADHPAAVEARRAVAADTRRAA